MSSFDDISRMFQTESEKLAGLINNATKSKLSVHEIVETYYQIMNISSMTTMLKQQLDGTKHESLLKKIAETEKTISDEFNSKIHPQIMENLSKSIQETTDNLQAGNSAQKSKEEIENEAKLYDELRQQMSTREFVEQYDKGI
ncbi:hypothetical protein NsoK4_05525 [Nitrosopumilus sp. K4]|uniref:hypothetical protein n=1 Tax=Nitrosopumilus sp. K4 TaxID=2795383 RepID=UPI001BA71F1F|nr:hypothetical protein [Nitrosopumilus sp. K4]QUC63924.1 hypothetical protein NsoK4_05525 [Nitrosopumilus sp. K4]